MRNERAGIVEQVKLELASFTAHVTDADTALDERRSPLAAADHAREAQKRLDGLFPKAREKERELAADPAEPNVLSVTDLQNSFAAVSERLAAVEGRIDAARRGFVTLKQALEAAGHVPLQGLDGGNRASQRVEVCAVGDALIDIRVPTEEFNGTNHYHLQCERAETEPSPADTNAAGAADRNPLPEARWDLTFGIDQIDAFTGKKQTSAPLGAISIESGTLVVTLNAYRLENEFGRAALSVAALQITSALAGEGTPPPELTTHVQLVKPLQAGPLVLTQFLKGDRNSTEYPPPRLEQAVEGRLSDAGAALEWPIVAAFRGQCGGLTGTTVPGLGWREKLLCWGMEWRWQDEPIVSTEFVIGKQEPGRVLVKVIRGTLADAWATRETLVPLARPRLGFGGMPTDDDLKEQTKSVYVRFLEPTINELVDELIKDREATTSVVQLRTMFRDIAAQSLESWRETLRGRLAATEGYRAWVNLAHPDPGPPSEEQDRSRHKLLAQAHRDAADANDQYVEEYRKDLEPRLQEPDCTELDAALIIRLRDRLAAIAEGKSRVRKLLADAGLLPDSTGPNATSEWPEARITGGCHIDFPSLGPGVRTVLVSFEELPAGIAPEDGRDAVNRSSASADF